MKKTMMASSIVGLLAPLLVGPTVFAAQSTSTQGSSSVAASRQVAASSSSVAGPASFSSQATSSASTDNQPVQAQYFGRNTAVQPGNSEIIDATTGDTTHAWGFDQDVVNILSPVYVNDNGAGTSAVGQVPLPVYQNAGELVAALEQRGLSQQQISEMVAVMMLTAQGTYKGDYTPIKNVSSSEQAAIYNYQVQSVLDLIAGQKDPHQAAFIKSNFTPFQQKLYDAALANANVDVSAMTTASLVTPGTNQPITKLQLNLKTNETPQFALNSSYLGAPVKVSQILPAGYQVIDAATNQPVSELTTGKTYYVKTSKAVAKATVAMNYVQDTFHLFTSNCKPIMLDEWEITPLAAIQIPVYYNSNGGYIGSLPTYNGYPVIQITGMEGYRNVSASPHMYDRNNYHASRQKTYEGLMTQTSMLANLTLDVFADVPTPTPAPGSSSSSSAGSSSQQAVSSSSERSATGSTTASSRTSSVRVATAQRKEPLAGQSPTSRFQQQVVPASASSKQQRVLPETGNQHSTVLAVIGGLLVAVGAVVLAGWTKQKKVK